MCEHVWNNWRNTYTTRRKLRLSDKNVSQCHIVHHKSHMHWLKTAFGAAAWVRAWASVVVCCVHRGKSVKLISPAGKLFSMNIQNDRNMQDQNYKRWIYTKMQVKMRHEHTSSEAWFWVTDCWRLQWCSLCPPWASAGLSRLTADCLNFWKIPGAVRVISNTRSTVVLISWCMYHALCVIYYLDQQMHYTLTIKSVSQSIPTCFDVFTSSSGSLYSYTMKLQY